MSTTLVRLERDGSSDLAEIVLASPPLNLFDRPLIDDLIAAVGEVAADPPRALLELDLRAHRCAAHALLREIGRALGGRRYPPA